MCSAVYAAPNDDITVKQSAKPVRAKQCGCGKVLRVVAICGSVVLCGCPVEGDGLVWFAALQARGGQGRQGMQGREGKARETTRNCSAENRGLREAAER